MALLRSTAIIGGLTLCSRVLGLVRDVLIARFLGAGPVSDAFFTAFKLPNLFRRMFAEGAFNAAFVPLYARKIENAGEAEADKFASEAGSVLLFAVTLLVVAFEVTMPWALNLIGSGLDKVAADGVLPTYDLAVLYSRLTMPYLAFMAMAALFSGILNTRNFFALAAGVQIALNVCMISALALVSHLGLGQRMIGLVLSGAVTVSGSVQMGLVWWGCRRAGVTIKFRRPRLTPDVRRLFVLGVPGIISAGITQINLLVSHSIATFQNSAASWLSYADRLYQLPLGMIGIAMGVALLPSLSRALRSGDAQGARRTLNSGIEIAAFLTLPAAVALYVMPDFLISGVYERGAFTAETTVQVAKALKYFALGLPAFVLIKILTPAFFAREDTKTPMVWAAVSAAINISLGLYLFRTIGFQGLALATSIAAWVNVLGLGSLLLRDGGLTPNAGLVWRVARMGLASVVMGGVLWAALPRLPDLSATALPVDFLWLGLVSALGFAAYLVAASLLRAYRVADIRSAFSKKG